jgi:hypothetical protein
MGSRIVVEIKVYEKEEYEELKHQAKQVPNAMPGAIIECISSDHNYPLTVGKQYEVLKQSKRGGTFSGVVIKKNDKNKSAKYKHHYFKLISQPSFDTFMKGLSEDEW